MQVKLRQLAYTAVLVVAIFIAGARLSQASAATLALPTVSINKTVNNIAVERQLNPFYPKFVGSGVPAKIIFKRTQVNNSFDNLGLKVFYNITGSASDNDFVGLSDRSVYFPPNVYEIELSINATDDQVYEQGGDVAIFSLTSDTNIRSPKYIIGKENTVKILIEDSNLSGVIDFTANNQAEVTISSGQPVLLEFISAFVSCHISGGQFGEWTWIDLSPRTSFPAGQGATWAMLVYPTETVDYTVRCIGYGGAPSSDTVRVNVTQ